MHKTGTDFIGLVYCCYMQIQEAVGAESRELQSYRAKMEKWARREEELFTRAPLTKMEKKKEKHLLKSRSGYAISNRNKISIHLYSFSLFLLQYL